MGKKEDFYDRVGEEIGWDFSDLDTRIEPEKKDFYRVVGDHLDEESIVLDLGTGGGKKALTLRDECLLLVGIDNSEEMIKRARGNVSEGSPNVKFFRMDAKELVFPGSFFNVVSCRQAPFKSDEVYRVLTEGGIFLTQQVSPDDKGELKEFFGRGQNYGRSTDTFMEELRERLLSAGFGNVQLEHYRMKEYFESKEDLEFLLRNTPVIEDFGRRKDRDRLEEFVEKNESEKGISTSSCRVVIKAEK